MLSFPFATGLPAVTLTSMDRTRNRPTSTSLHDENDPIVVYWNRRDRLTTAEWVDFYQRVVPLLMRTRLPEEYSDERRRRDLVDCFFQDKVFLNAGTSKAGPLQTTYALHRYLKNYELDLRRVDGQRSSFDGTVDASAPPTEDALDNDSSIAHARLLQEAGIDLEFACRSAHAFLVLLSDGERAFLRDHSCADEDEAQPLSTIAKRWAMGSSYHYQAKKLGITREKGDTFDGYEKSKIGGWLLSVGARLTEEWRAELAALLIVLCLQVGIHPGGRQP